MGTVSINGLDKAKVLAALYNASKPQGFGFMHYTHEPLSEEKAAELLSQSTYFDYLNGRVMKVDLSGDELQTNLYNRDNGENAAERIIKTLQQTGDTNAEEIEHRHLENTRNSAILLKKHIHDETTLRKTGDITEIHLGLSDVGDLFNDKLNEIIGSE